MLTTLVILGANGDLTRRLLLPALGRLLEAKCLPDQFAIVGVGKDELDTESYRAVAADALGEFAPKLPAGLRADLVSRISYVRGDVTSAADLRVAVPTAEPVIVYLALPNVIFDETLTALAEVGIAAGSVVAIEKPFGESEASAQALNDLVHRVVPEDFVFRIDHFLAKSTVIDVLGLRFANRIWEPVWNASHVERIDIVWDESLALEGRAGYYDRAGALKDMLQNHLLQIFALVAMEPPLSMRARDLRDRKLDVLRAVRTMTAAEVAAYAVRARYSAGTIADRDIPAYVDEPGVEPSRQTETYAEMTLAVDNWRWAGVPFRLRSGKGLGEECREIRITFRPVPHQAFGGPTAPAQNVLRIRMRPDAISLSVNLVASGQDFSLDTAELELPLQPETLEAYSLLFLEILRGDPTLAIGAEEAEECWRIVAPILAAWEAGALPIEEYPAGSAGPRPIFGGV